MVLRNFSSSSGKHRILFSEIVEYPTSIEGSLTNPEAYLVWIVANSTGNGIHLQK